MRSANSYPVELSGYLARLRFRGGGSYSYVCLEPGSALQSRCTGRLPKVTLCTDDRQAELVSLKDLPLLVLAAHMSQPGVTGLLEAELVATG